MKKYLLTTAVFVAMTGSAFAAERAKKVEKVDTMEVEPAVVPAEPARYEKVEKEERVETKKDNSGLFLEPAVTYETGKGTIDFKSVAQPDGNLKGVGLGLRVGGHINDILFLALDTSYSKPKFTDENGNFNYDLKSWLAGVTLGAQTPVVGLRVWGSYLPFGEITLSGRGSNDTNIKYKDPKIWKVGAGFRISAISLNLEYLHGDYTKLQVENAGTLLTGDYNGDATRKSWIASVSFPLAL
jgi:hypothetical protein